MAALGAVLLAFDVLEEVRSRVIKGSFIDSVNDALANSAFSGVGVNGPHGFQLLQVPQDGLIAGANGSAYVARSAAIRVLPEVAEDFGPEWVDAKDRDHSFGAFWDRDRGAYISGHTFILSYRHSCSFHCLIEYDTLQRKCPKESDTMEGVPREFGG